MCKEHCLHNRNPIYVEKKGNLFLVYLLQIVSVHCFLSTFEIEYKEGSFPILYRSFNFT